MFEFDKIFDQHCISCNSLNIKQSNFESSINQL